MLQALKVTHLQISNFTLQEIDFSGSTWNRWEDKDAFLSGKVYDSKGLKVQKDWKSPSPFILLLTKE